MAGLVPECSGSLGHGSWLDLLPFSSFQWMHIVHTNPYADKYGETTQFDTLSTSYNQYLEQETTMSKSQSPLCPS